MYDSVTTQARSQFEPRRPGTWLAALALAVTVAAPLSAARTPQYPTPIATGTVDGHSEMTQLSHGVYDAVSNRTFVVFPGCYGGGNVCTVDPYIKYYNHNTGNWSSELRLGASGDPADSHYYPQVVLDDQRYLHVFNGLHSGDPIQHYKSTVTAGHSQIMRANRWQSVGFGSIDNHPLFDRATYARALKANDGTIYVFYRQTVKGGTREDEYEDWFEPYCYVRSSDNGATWDAPRLLFVPATAAQCPSAALCEDGDKPTWDPSEEWDTIYGLAHTYDPVRNGVHFAFARTEFHANYVDKNFYAFLDFENLTVYDAAGNSNGAFLTEDEMLASNRNYVFVDFPGDKTPIDGPGSSAAVAAGSAGVTVFSNRKVAYGDRPIDAITWQGSGWSPASCIAGLGASCEIFSQWTYVGDAKMFDDGTLDLYFTSNYADGAGQPVHDVMKAHKGPEGWDFALLATQGGQYGFNALGRIQSPHVEATVTFMEKHCIGECEDLTRTGKVFSWGHRNHVFAVKKQGGSNSTEIHILDGAHTFKKWFLNTGTALGTTGTDRSWEFELGDYNGDGVYDVYAIAKTNTGSGMTEVHVLDGATGFQTFLLHNATILHATGSDRAWEFELGDYNGDGKLDLYGIKRTGTASGQLEVHVLNGANNFQSFLVQTPTYIHGTGPGTRWDYELGDYDGDGKLDLYCIDKLQSLAINHPKIYILSGATLFGTLLKAQVLAIPSTDGSARWNYELGDYNHDSVLDLYAIERSGHSSGKTTFHVLDGLSEYQNYLHRSPTILEDTGSDGAWEFMILP